MVGKGSSRQSIPHAPRPCALLSESLPCLEIHPRWLFFFAPLSTYNPSFSPPRSFTTHRPSTAPASLYVLSFSNMQACVQTLCSSLKSCELLPHANRPSSLSFAWELHQLPLVVFPWGGEREGGNCLRLLFSGPSPFHLAWLRSLHPHRGVIR